MPGYDKLRFVDVSNHDLEEFTCGICIEIIYKPLVTPCCRQTYCSDCINEWLTDNNTCPNDRKKLRCNDLNPPPRAFINLLNNMKIRCDYHINGCEKIIQLNSLSTHIANCDFDPKKKCKFCGLSKEKELKHNCVQNLVVINKRLNNKIDKLVKENSVLKKKLENNSSVRTESCDSKDMYSVIESALKVINNPEIEISSVSSLMRVKAIAKMKEAITKNNSYSGISRFLAESFNKENNQKRWHVITYARKCGESSLWSDDYICISLGQLRIEIFSVGFRSD